MGYSTDRLFELKPLNGSETLQLPKVFGWFHYVQDFSGEFATDWLERLSAPGDVVWDPF